MFLRAYFNDFKCYKSRVLIYEYFLCKRYYANRKKNYLWLIFIAQLNINNNA
jgi:hypothetical protein